MTVVLKTQDDGDNVNLTTVSKNKSNRSERVKDDLDQYFTESAAQEQASDLGLPYINLYGYPIDSQNLLQLTKEEVEKSNLGVFSKDGKIWLIVTTDPNNPLQSEMIAKLESNGYKTKLYLCSHLSFSKLLKAYEYVFYNNQIDEGIKLDLKKEDKIDLKNLKDILSTTSTSEIIETILKAALQNNASDIHFEPEKTNYVLRLRLDGVLYTFANLPISLIKKIESRVKVLSSLKLNVDNIPQDGRFSFYYDQKEIDVRVSMLPSNYGYSIVMRLLGTGSVKLMLDDLGFWKHSKDKVDAALSKPQGMILNTGPTGSGKTTTLYTFLNQLNDSQSKIITLEDPIEYKLTGISQTQIDKQGGYTFAAGLKSILRQDPDIVMVGEIRDGETADIAVESALTGHLVLSTLHTNDAAGAITRLMEMGIKGFLLADSLSAIIGQRLVRRLCQDCKRVETLDENQKKIVISALSEISSASGVVVPEQLTFWTSDGCEQCNGLGYKGRVGVYEVLTITNGLRELISNRYPSIVEVRTVAVQEGMITMLQDGVLKALDGLTDMKELLDNVSS
jgi:type IV pilus assembly protein PilB